MTPTVDARNDAGSSAADERNDIASNTTEHRARAALEACFQRPLSDEEWQTYKARLVAYARILHEWSQQ
jgi:hypothetical protein